MTEHVKFGVTPATDQASKKGLTRPLHIVLPGGRGQLGGILARHLHFEGHNVAVFTRRVAAAPWRMVCWDGSRVGAWVEELEGADVVINLAGRSVNCRYNAANRREIMESRIGTTQAIGEAMRGLRHPPRLWMNASTATIYRHAPSRAMDEVTGEIGGSELDAPSSWHFSIEVATRWEECFFRANTPYTRKIALRSAVVMSPHRGGAFDLLSRLVRFGLGGQFGSGEQYVSWIHDADFVRAVDHLISNEDFEGVVNIAAPNPLPNSEFMRALRRAWGRRLGVPTARWMLEAGAVFLRTETELILKSRRVIPGRLLKHGFRFDFPEWPAAAQDLAWRWRSRFANRQEAGLTAEGR